METRSGLEPLTAFTSAPFELANQATARVAKTVAELPIKTVEVAANTALRLTAHAARSVVAMGVNHAKREMLAAITPTHSRGMERG
jgi:hypothetical protein